MHALHLLSLGLLLIFFGGSCAQQTPVASLSATATATSQPRAALHEGPVEISVAVQVGIDAPGASVSLEKLQQLLRLWIAEEPEAALTFLHELPHANLRAKLLPPALRQWAARDIVSASDWVMRRARTAEEKTVLLRESICGLASADPAEALLWFSVMTPDVRARFDGSENFFWENYLTYLPADAASRIPLLPAGPLKTKLASAFARTLAATDRVAAEWWAEEIADAAARSAALAVLRQG